MIFLLPVIKIHSNKVSCVFHELIMNETYSSSVYCYLYHPSQFLVNLDKSMSIMQTTELLLQASYSFSLETQNVSPHGRTLTENVTGND